MKLGKYYILFYTDNLPANVGGRTNGPIIRIKTKYKNDKGIHEHEKTHARQFWLGWWSLFVYHGLMYKFSEKYRLAAEVEAYKEQLKYSPNNVDYFARFLAEHYNLDISITEAKKLLV